MGEETKEYDLEDRLINFAVLIIDIVELLPNTRAGNHVAGQHEWNRVFLNARS